MSIVKMSRLKLLAMQSDRDRLIHELMLLGCTEITESAEKLTDPDWAALARKEESKLSDYRTKYSKAASALKTLDKYAHEKAGLFPELPRVTAKELFSEELSDDAEEAVDRIHKLEDDLSELYGEVSKLSGFKASMELWKGLEEPLDFSSTKHTFVVFGTMPAFQPYEAMAAEMRALTDQIDIEKAGQDKEQCGFFVVCHRNWAGKVEEILRKYGCSRASFDGAKGTAAQNIAETEAEIERHKKAIEDKKKEIAGSAADRAKIKLYCDRLTQHLAEEEAKEKLLATDKVFCLYGWVPTEDLPKLEKELSNYACTYEIREAERAEEGVPIKLKSNKLTEPMNMVTEMYSLPAYNGIDPNPWILPFFTVFFGIMFADMGYGLVLFIGSLIIKKKATLKGTMKYMIGLATLCGITSFIFGALTGSFFGDSITVFGGLIGKDWALPYLLSPMQDPMTILIGSLVLGAIQIIVGMSIKVYMLIRDGQFWSAVFDVGSWWLVFAGIAVLALGGTKWVLIAGVAALVLTQGRDKPTFIGKLIGGIASLYDITGYFGDILSYTRLMALILAGGVVASVVNMLGALPGSIIAFLIIFAVGQTFNMAINIIGTYVHAARLQYLEFFGKFYIDGGKPFKPLSVNTKYVYMIKEEK